MAKKKARKTLEAREKDRRKKAQPLAPARSGSARVAPRKFSKIRPRSNVPRVITESLAPAQSLLRKSRGFARPLGGVTAAKQRLAKGRKLLAENIKARKKREAKAAKRKKK